MGGGGSMGKKIGLYGGVPLAGTALMAALIQLAQQQNNQPVTTPPPTGTVTPAPQPGGQGSDLPQPPMTGTPRGYPEGLPPTPTQ